MFLIPGNRLSMSVTLAIDTSSLILIVPIIYSGDPPTHAAELYFIVPFKPGDGLSIRKTLLP